MDCTSIPYRQTGYFSAIVSDYINNAPALQPFLQHPANKEGLEAAIGARKKVHTNRSLLVTELEKQYAPLPAAKAVQDNIQLLLKENTYTITTAHQPNIFTGYLYFIYKILHAIKLAEYCKQQWPADNFVPVFYMGSEDADLDELGSIFLNGEKLTWQTQQTGAVGRMNTKGLDAIIQRLEGELSIQPYGKELIALLKDAYLRNNTIQDATLSLVHSLFSEYGLVIILPDNSHLKRVMIPVFEEELLNQTASAIIEPTLQELAQHYKVQAQPREINLFYLKDDIRERIIYTNDVYKINNTNLEFTRESLLQELHEHPERFSPNVILRGLFQETILPNIAFIGGGGELAYWLELKKLFEHYKVPYPVLIVRNSFLLIEKKWKEKMDKLQLSIPDIFLDEQTLMNRFVQQESTHQLKLTEEIADVQAMYNKIQHIAGSVDVTLVQHTEALKTAVLKRLQVLEKKMLRAEKRKFEEMGRSIHAVKNALFPNGNLQERVENFAPFYAKWGKEWVRGMYEVSEGVGGEFGVVVG